LGDEAEDSSKRIDGPDEVEAEGYLE